MSNADYPIPSLPSAHRGKATIFHLRNLSGSPGNGSFDPPVCFEQTQDFVFFFLQSFVDRLSSEWWNIRSDRSQKRRTGRGGSGKVKVKTTCSDPELPGPLYDSSLLYVYNDWPGLLYSVPGIDRSFLLSAVIRGIWTIVCRRPFAL